MLKNQKNGYLANDKSYTTVIVCFLILSSCIISINSVFTFNAGASSGAPPINGTTTMTWYVDGLVTRANEWINTTDIQINDTGALDWMNLKAEVSGNISVNDTGYFNLTNCDVILNGNLLINGSVNLKNVTLQMNCTYDGEYYIEVNGSMHILDFDSDNTTMDDASNIRNGSTDNAYKFWVREGASFSMVNSKLTSCGYGGSNRGLTIQANSTLIDSNELINNDNGLVIESPSNGNNISNNVIQFSGSGLLIDSSSNNNISSNKISNCYYGIIIGQGSNNNITHNSIKSCYDGVYLFSASYNNITWNTISDHTLDGIELSSSTYNVIDHNTISNNPDDGIDIDANSDYNTVSNNTISSCTYGTMITSADYNTIINNSYSNNVNSSVGLYQGSTNNKIINNLGTGSNASISAVQANGNYFEGNTLWANQGGFGFLQSSNNQILRNNVTLNTLNGLTFILFCANNEVHQNRISNNSVNGIYVFDSASAVDAIYNWWGSDTGPYHSTTNPTGTGDTVSDYVTYKPWGLQNYPPTIDIDEEIHTTEDLYFELQLAGFDRNGDSITWVQSSNATWLNWGETNHTLYGTPENSDVGSYWVLINVSDTYGDYKEYNSTLNVTNVPLEIIEADVTNAFEDTYYFNDYSSTDDGSGTITWGIITNASWITMNTSNGELYGTPGNDDVGWYWVNISVTDGNSGFDLRSFKLYVLNENDNPEIITNDKTTINEDELYQANYEATDIDPGTQSFTWSLSTNASWLKINNIGNLSGIPTNTDVGSYWVNVSVSDGHTGLNWSNFTLKVININDPPHIITEDKLVATVEKLYSVDYNGTDIDPTKDTLTWTLSTNASSWLIFDANTGLLSGTPLFTDGGVYWVNITLVDGRGGLDWHNFTLKVESIMNQDPEIISEHGFEVEVGFQYSFYFKANDDRTSESSLSWSFRSNASWLTFNIDTGLLSGTPKLNHVGSYWVYISVLDNDGGLTFTNFTIKVPKPFKENEKPKLTNGNVSPSSGDTDTEFSFSVQYSDPEGDEAEYVRLVLDDELEYIMKLALGDNSNGTWEVKLNLSKGVHKYYFKARSGIDIAISGDNTPINPENAKNTPDVKEVKDTSEEMPWVIILGLILVVIVVLVLVIIIVKRSKKLEEDQDDVQEDMEELEVKMEEHEDDLMARDQSTPIIQQQTFEAGPEVISTEIETQLEE